MRYQPIENYGVIGDLHTVALVGMNGSIDFMCFPEFDSPTIFARLLDYDKGGYFQIAPARENARYKQLYLPDTNVLFTRFLFGDGVAEISDFMPVETYQPTHELVRRVKAVWGEFPFRMVCKPAFDYARSNHRVEIREGEILFISDSNGGTVLRLRTDVPVRLDNDGVVAEFTLKMGETASFVLEEVRARIDSRSKRQDYVSEAFKNTVNYWHDWIGQSQYQGRWRELVNRSALVLKLMTSWKWGSMVAAPTFGLPEEIGGERNWDYRYTWIRDASFTVYALIRLGYTSEAAAFMNWITDRSASLNPDGSMQIMYGLDGRQDLDECTLDHFEGYKASSPVRIGNGAYKHLQLDIYGELLDAVYLSDKYGQPISHDLWQNLSRMIDWVRENWQQPDEGIWEVRGGRRHFLYSRMMCWVALDRGVRLAQKRSLPAPIEIWRAARDEIYADIFKNFWHAKRGAFVQYMGGNALDASSLLMPLVRFISPTDPYWLSHLKAIEEELVYDSLVYRYSPEKAAWDGLLGQEGTFSICTFWYVECLSRASQLDKARFYFEKMLGYGNHLGLFAEELSRTGVHLGNYPQAFTHLALISAAYDLDRRLSAKG